MALRLVQANFKARDDSALGRFWAAALDWVVSSDGTGATGVAPEGFVWTDPDAAVCIDVIAVPDPETVKYRVHIDLATTSAAHQTELVARLQELGATPADVGQGDVPWTVLADPEGNVFCVLEPREIYRDTGPIAAVVVDCTDPRAMARFWGEAIDWTLHEVADDYATLRSAKGVGPYLEFLRTPDVKPGRNRVHLDLVPYSGDDQAAEAARLQRVSGAALNTLGRANFDVVITRDDVTRPKPDPEPCLRAAEQLGVPATACIAVEDSTAGVTSARAAGATVIAISSARTLPAAPGILLCQSLRAVDVAYLRSLAA